VDQITPAEDTLRCTSAQFDGRESATAKLDKYAQSLSLHPCPAVERALPVSSYPHSSEDPGSVRSFCRTSTHSEDSLTTLLLHPV
jgi:hypothetical protein